MAEPEIAVLLRTCKHTDIPSTPNTTLFGYALKCDNVVISYTKTPIQVPIPKNSPILIDIGVYRPTISLTGVVDTKPGRTSSNTVPDFWYMDSISFTRTTGYGGGSGAKTYYVPYKNKLEDFITDQTYSSSTPLELEFGDASYSISPSSSITATGGAVYEVALQQARFQVDAAKEDRYNFSMQFVVTERMADS
tara:strand:+ start:2510 stop:3088 length:579 start_codon:yes stop_codon:yes gene_type:complete